MANYISTRPVEEIVYNSNIAIMNIIVICIIGFLIGTILGLGTRQ